MLSAIPLVQPERLSVANFVRYLGLEGPAAAVSRRAPPARRYLQRASSDRDRLRRRRLVGGVDGLSDDALRLQVAGAAVTRGVPAVRYGAGWSFDRRAAGFARLERAGSDHGDRAARIWGKARTAITCRPLIEGPGVHLAMTDALARAGVAAARSRLPPYARCRDAHNDRAEM